MSAADDQRPWWASADADGGPDTDGGPDWRVVAESVVRAIRELGDRVAGPPSGDAPHRHDPTDAEACRLCPVCAGLRAIGAARPEVIGHLGAAARHLTLAVKAIVDTQAGAADDDGLRRIDLDDHEPAEAADDRPAGSEDGG